MKTQYLHIEKEHSIDKTASLLLLGQVVAIPTETVYGLGICYNLNKGIEKLCSVKKRDSSKSIAICLDSYQSIKKIVTQVPDLFWVLAKRFFPGPLTIVFCSEKGSIGIRIPEHDLCRELIKKTGPLYVTSANYSNCTDVINPLEVYETFQGTIAGVLADNNKLKYNKCSTVIKIESSNSVRLLREGPIPWEAIEACLVSFNLTKIHCNNLY